MSKAVGLPVSYVYDLAIGKQSRAGAIGLLFYDHVLNLDREIRFIWAGDKTRPAFWLYIFSRFFAFAYYIFDTIPLSGVHESPSKMCAIYLMCDGIVTTLATLAVQIILQLRIYALYERSQKVLVFLVALCAIEISIMAVLIGVTMGHLEKLPIMATATGCAYKGFLHAQSLFWIPALVFEPILFLMVAYKAWSPTREDFHRVPLITQMARDSMLYFVAVFVELLVSTVVWAHAPQYINIFNPWSAALPSLMGSRLMLSMREAVAAQHVPDSYILENFTVSSAFARRHHHHGSLTFDSGDDDDA